MKHSCWQEMVRYFIRAYNDGQHNDPNCRVVPRFISANSLLGWLADTFGEEYEKCRAVNWDTVKSLNCIVSCILDWAHLIPMDKWSVDPPAGCRVQGGRERVVVALVKRRLPFQPVRQGQPHAAVDPPESSPPQFIGHSCAEASRDKSGLKCKEEGAPADQQGERVWWCYNWYYRYDKHCTTAYKWHYSEGHGTSKNDSGKTKFCDAYYSTEGHWNISTCESAESSAYLRQGKVQCQGQL